MIGGTLFTHNCISQDYCFREALDSLLGVCDEIVVVDAESTDGTTDALHDSLRFEPRARVLKAKWSPEPHKAGKWLSDLANLAREALRSDFHVALQADEVLHEDDYPLIRQASKAHSRMFLMRRFNFWRDGKHLAPHGEICGHNITRMGPQYIPFVGDAENLNQEFPDIRQSEARIFHYGFLRTAEAQRKKGIAMEEAFWGTHNPIFDRMEKEGRKPFDEEIIKGNLIEYSDTHPKVAHLWLQNRGRI